MWTPCRLEWTSMLYWRNEKNLSYYVFSASQHLMQWIMFGMFVGGCTLPHLSHSYGLQIKTALCVTACHIPNSHKHQASNTDQQVVKHTQCNTWKNQHDNNLKQDGQENNPNPNQDGSNEQDNDNKQDDGQPDEQDDHEQDDVRGQCTCQTRNLISQDKGVPSKQEGATCSTISGECPVPEFIAKVPS